MKLNDVAFMTHDLGGGCSEHIAVFLLTFEQEREFFQRLSVCLREQEVDEDDLARQQSNIHEEELPVKVLESDRVGEGTQHDGAAIEELKPRKAFGTHIVREDLNHVDVGESIVSDVVCGLVQEDHDKHSVASFF